MELGLILILNDITRQLETDSDLNLGLQSFSRSVRASLAGIRSAIETIIEFPQMEVQQLDALKGIIHKESLIMGEILESRLPGDSRNNYSQWPLITMTVKDLAELIKSKAGDNLQVDLHVEDFDPLAPDWIILAARRHHGFRCNAAGVFWRYPDRHRICAFRNSVADRSPWHTLLRYTRKHHYGRLCDSDVGSRAYPSPSSISIPPAVSG